MDLAHLKRIFDVCFDENPELRFTMENPYNSVGGMHQTKLVQDWLEKLPRVRRMLVHYCMFGDVVHKPTLIWTNVRMLAAALEGLVCKPGMSCCHSVRSEGKHRERVEGKNSSITAAFPQLLADLMALYINAEVSALREAARVAEDGAEEHNAGDGDAAGDGDDDEEA